MLLYSFVWSFCSPVITEYIQFAMIQDAENQSKANPHIGEAETKERLVFLLEKCIIFCSPIIFALRCKGPYMMLFGAFSDPDWQLWGTYDEILGRQSETVVLDCTVLH